MLRSYAFLIPSVLGTPYRVQTGFFERGRVPDGTGRPKLVIRERTVTLLARRNIVAGL